MKPYSANFTGRPSLTIVVEGVTSACSETPSAQRGKLILKTVKAAHNINHETGSIFLERSFTIPSIVCVARAPPPANSSPKRKIRGYRKFSNARIGRMIHRASGAPRQRRSQLREFAYAIRTVRSDRDARHLCVGEPQSLVHPGIRSCLRARLCLWFSARRLALWSGRGHLVGRGPAPLASGAAVKGLCGDGAGPVFLIPAQSLFSPSSAATLYASA